MTPAPMPSPGPASEDRGAPAVVRTAIVLVGLALLLSPSVSRPEPASPKAAAAPQAKGAADTAKATDANASEADAVLAKLRTLPGAIVGKTATGKTIAEAPPFTVLSRKSLSMYYPCTQCHDPSRQPNRQIRVLKEEHTDLKFQHGGGNFWCYTCHNAKNMDTLRTLRGTPVDFDQAYKVCGQCHFERELDWAFGGHGKRVGAFPYPRKIPVSHEDLLVRDRSKIGHWRGKRELIDCTGCHNPHSPAITPFTPSPPPVPRRGLTRPKGDPLARPPPGLPLGPLGKR